MDSFPGCRLLLVAASVAALLALTTAPAGAATGLPTGFEELTLASGIGGPTSVAWTPDGRMLVTQKYGALRVVSAAGVLAGAPVIDISDHVSSYSDHGLLDVAVDSNFAFNRYVYLLYTYENDPSLPDGPKTSRLTRIVLNPDNSVTGPETVLLGTTVGAGCPAPSNTVDCLPSEGGSHSIGTVRADPDGTLWVGSGDASDYGRVDPLALRTYDERSLAGKVMHVDRNGHGLSGHAFCPTDADLSHNCTKVFAKGFRNPFRFSLRGGGAGPAVADVGWNTREELDFTAAGRNYGWPCYEGTIHTPGYESLDACQAEYAAPTASGPVYDYAHVPDTTSAIVAGPTYAGTGYPGGYRGDIFLGDFGRQYIKRLELNGQGAPTGTIDFAAGWGGVDLEAGPNGDLVSVNFGDGSPATGTVTRFVYSPGNATPIARASATPTSGAAPLAVALKGSDSSDPDGDPLTYDWDFGDGSAHSSAADPSHTYSAIRNYTATLTVGDGSGRTGTATVAIAAGNSPPVPAISAPTDGALYRDGTPIDLRGSATDPQDGAVPSASLSWHVILHHGDHIHDFGTFTGASASFTPATDHDADSHYEIALTARDSGGLTASRTVTIVPQTAAVSIASSPTGAPVSYGGSAHSAPFTTSSAVGFETSVSAASEFQVAGAWKLFDHWTDGGARLHDLTVPVGGASLTAVYRSNANPVARPSASPSAGPAPLAVQFHGDSSSDPDDGQTLSYDWDFGDGSAHSSAINPSHTYAGVGGYTAKLTVTDGRGGSGSKNVPVAADNETPAVTIAAPLEGATYRDGTDIALRGSANDPQDGALGDPALRWHVVLRDGDQDVDLGTQTGAQASFHAGTDRDASASYAVTLTATDSNGGSGSATVNVVPETVSLHLESSPPGAPLQYSGRDVVAPFALDTAIGFEATVTAAETFGRDGHTYGFSGWSDGGARVHGVAVPSTETTLRADYLEVATAPPGEPGLIAGSADAPPAPSAPPVGAPPPPAAKRRAAKKARARLTVWDPFAGRSFGSPAHALAGTLRGARGAVAVQLAIRSKTKAAGGCRWWSRRARRVLRAARPCRPPLWMRAVVGGRGERRTWRLALNGALAPGSYTVLARALDARGAEVPTVMVVSARRR